MIPGFDRASSAQAWIVGEIEASGGRAGYAVGDVGDLEQVKSAAADAVARFGRIDIWVNVAGVAVVAMVLNTRPRQSRTAVPDKLLWHGQRRSGGRPHLHEKGGALISVGSIASDITGRSIGAYAASKHAIKTLVSALRIELAAQGSPIPVTLIKPSGIDTPLSRHAETDNRLQAQLPPPLYDPKLVADAILVAAEHRRRAITAGGNGRVKVLFGTYTFSGGSRKSPPPAPRAPAAAINPGRFRATSTRSSARDAKDRASRMPGAIRSTRRLCPIRE